ncbi:cytochrome c oxidase assembly factor Coa1 family protein [uncultured Lacinutrix sp.]|uniref:cytochrome c oxidase assembly factor Coa1 family protein n=1 Tax=uncultured Lacinutrix sp. TaxID=574032 RepID=UPI00260AABEA|nr:cytochrome c oxidase assembly factor Coa1 family protein [uncultured Lacinutrix sp.]
MEEIRQKSWFSRNWGWLLGGGCLSIIVVVILVIVGAFYKISDSISGSEPYTYAFSQAIENEEVIGFLGEPIESDGMGSTNYSYKNGYSIAELNIPIKGPNGEGVIVVNAEKVDEEWQYSQLYFLEDSSTEIINLLDPVYPELYDN